MKTSLNWLKSYVDFDLDIDALAHLLTMIGFEVENVEKINPFFTNVVTGHVKEVFKHPDADKLSVCQVDVGDELLQIICGAPNVRPDIFVPVVRIGGTVGDMEIKRVKLRGIESFGMICSERELGISANHEGILLLEGPLLPGTPFMPDAQVVDYQMEVNVTPNRPDCLSHIGIARELSAHFQTSLRLISEKVTESEQDIAALASVEIMDTDACPRYSARVIQNVKVASSPDWLKSRLNSVGIRSINNVVDITNYVLMETGHPLHAFDYDQISGHRIIVRKANDDENFITLDGTNRKLSKKSLLICDTEKAVALAGIMGGQNSEVTGHTVNILLESAYFDPMTVRKTAKQLGMSTEASYRFERGADPNGTLYALNRATQLMHELAGGEISKGIIDEYPTPIQSKTIELRANRVKQVLGIAVPSENIEIIFSHLGFKLRNSIEDEIMLWDVPAFRHDLNREIDLIEEIVRHYGYDHIPPRSESIIPLQTIKNENHEKHDQIRQIMSGIGFSETWHASLVSEKHVSVATSINEAVSIKNPLSPDGQYLRTILLPNLLDAVQWNIHRGEKNLRLFEIGKTFHLSGEKLPEEHWELCALICGLTAQKVHWRKKDEKTDYDILKGLLDILLKKLQIRTFEIVMHSNRIFENASGTELRIEDQSVGALGRLNTEILSHWEISEDLWMIRLNLNRLLPYIADKVTFIPFPRYPAVKRDLALIVKNPIHAGDLINLILKCGGDLIESVDVFDLYRGKPLNEDEKSIAFSLLFRHSDRTLKETEIEPIINKVLNQLENKFQATLRS